MAGIFKRRGRGSEPSEEVAGEEVSSEPIAGATIAGEAAVMFEPPRRGAVPRARRARADADAARAAEIARLSEDLKRELEAELAATRRQRAEVEAELAAARRRRAEIERELAAMQTEAAGPRLVAVEPPSAQARRG